MWPLLSPIRQTPPRWDIPHWSSNDVQHPAFVQRRPAVIPAGDPAECGGIEVRVGTNEMGPHFVLGKGRENRLTWSPQSRFVRSRFAFLAEEAVAESVMVVGDE